MDSAQAASWNIWRTARSGHKHRPQPTLQLEKKGLRSFLYISRDRSENEKVETLGVVEAAIRNVSQAANCIPAPTVCD